MKSTLPRIFLYIAVCIALFATFSFVGRLRARQGVEALQTVKAPAPVERGKVAPPSADVPRLFQHPTLSRSQIAFDFAGEIWIVSRAGGTARRLVSGQLANSRPIFSPDGSSLAFTGVYDGNADVYVVPTAGGEPRRLTFHPGHDAALGWTPDGTRVLFRSLRATPRDLPRLFTVSRDGGFPKALPLPSGNEASYSPDGKQLAYVPIMQWQPEWKKYRGGQTTPIWIADLADSQIIKVPRANSNDRSPMWVGDQVYFLSDRNGRFTLFGYDTKTREVRELIKNPDGLDLRQASAGPGAIVLEALGRISLYDLASKVFRTVPIRISADLPQVRARFEKIRPRQVLHAAISPTGKRVLLEAHGELLSVPTEKGTIRNITRTPAVADRDPAFSPDGKWIAWLSDDSGEYALHFRTADGQGPARTLALGDPPSFFYEPKWSPDSKKLVLSDKRLNLWLIDLDRPTLKKIDTDRYEGADFRAAWSPDSKFVAYTKQLPNFFHAIFIYSLIDGSSHQVTDGRSEALAPVFDRSGKYLWFLASTDVGIAQTGGMYAYGRPVTSSLYALVLDKSLRSPVAPQSDEEGDPVDQQHAGSSPSKQEQNDKGQSKAGKSRAVKPLKIDFAGLDQRIVAMPVKRARYLSLDAGAEGVVFLTAGPLAFSDEDYLTLRVKPPKLDVLRFDLDKRKAKPFVNAIDWGRSGLQTFAVSADGKKVLFAKDGAWFVSSSKESPKLDKGGADEEGGTKRLKTATAEVWVDPRAEWRQIYNEVWRIERDFLYDRHAHGLDLTAAKRFYARFLDGLGSRRGLNALLSAALGNLTLGHVWVDGGTTPEQRNVAVGLLGAEYSIEANRYRFARILSGENYNPQLRAPLTEPGVDVKQGDFLIAVNGQELHGDENLYRLFMGTAGKLTVLKVGPQADGTHSRTVRVVPIGSESALRLRTWMEDNRKRVDALSGGRVGYVFIPDTGGGGFASFNRYYFSQVGKEAVILDERFNHGGQIADYMIDILKRKPLMGATTREGMDVIFPMGAIYGPKVMIANEMSGSGGDALPWLFKREKLGPLVGKRTWGGLVGIGGYPKLIDGGFVTAPRWALYGIHGAWEVENVGIAPDIEVEQDPARVRKGHDPQLERAVELALAALAKTPKTTLRRPPYPNYHPKLPTVQP
ncbi:MAG: PD40 domain-containing protein [Deltaproteobacteria bacterium]|nr:PD40 domain-containing protein [Deltaproteobacteria bacterium]